MSHKQICGSVHQHISGQLLLHQTTTFCCVVDIIPAGYITLSAARNIPADTDETPWKRHRLCTVQNNVASSSLYEPRSWFSSKQMLYTDALLTSYRDKKKKWDRGCQLTEYQISSTIKKENISVCSSCPLRWNHPSIQAVASQVCNPHVPVVGLGEGRMGFWGTWRKEFISF